MPQSDPALSELLAFASEVAYEAGRFTLGHFQTRLEIERKADHSPVTIADRGAEARIVERIQERFPEDGILGEESGEREGHSRRRWIIDPIDGTKSFVRGVPLYAVLIGVEQDGEPVVGVAYVPGTDELVAAAKGLGCTWNGRPARVSKVSNLKEATLLSTDFEDLRARIGERYGPIFERVGLTRGWGDAYGHILVATGRAEIMLDPVLELWDSAPLMTIMQEAGGKYTDWAGRAHIHGRSGISTNGLLHDEVLALLHSEFPPH